MDDVLLSSTGGFHTMAVKTDGRLWVLGYNGAGALGDGTTMGRTKPIKIMDGVKLPSDVVASTQRENLLEFNGDSYEIKLSIKNIDGRSMLPFRECAELLGARVSWNGETKTAASELNGVKVDFIIGSEKYYVDGVERTMDIAPFIDGGSTYIPLRYLAEGLGYKVEFKQTVTENIYVIFK